MPHYPTETKQEASHDHQIYEQKKHKTEVLKLAKKPKGTGVNHLTKVTLALHGRQDSFLKEEVHPRHLDKEL